MYVSLSALCSDSTFSPERFPNGPRAHSVVASTRNFIIDSVLLCELVSLNYGLLLRSIKILESRKLRQCSVTWRKRLPGIARNVILACWYWPVLQATQLSTLQFITPSMAVTCKWLSVNYLHRDPHIPLKNSTFNLLLKQNKIYICGFYSAREIYWPSAAAFGRT